MPQFLIDRNIRVGGTVPITGDDAHHIIDVLRLKTGDWIVLADGRGKRFRAGIAELGKKSLSVRIDEELPPLPITNITLAQAVIKHDRIETIIQKAVELGVTKIIPFTSERTISKFSKNAVKIERWNKIAIEAAKQCGMAVKPAVENIISFEELILSVTDFDHKLMFFEGEEKSTLGEYFNNRGTEALGHRGTLITIGPEGGFTPEEIKLARKNDFTTLKLGPQILRVETAATTAIALVQSCLGYFDNGVKA